MFSDWKPLIGVFFWQGEGMGSRWVLTVRAVLAGFGAFRWGHQLAHQDAASLPLQPVFLGLGCLPLFATPRRLLLGLLRRRSPSLDCLEPARRRQAKGNPNPWGRTGRLLPSQSATSARRVRDRAPSRVSSQHMRRAEDGGSGVM